MLVRRDIQIADHNMALAIARAQELQPFISSRKESLCSNFGLSAGSGMSPPAGT